MPEELIKVRYKSTGHETVLKKSLVKILEARGTIEVVKEAKTEPKKDDKK